MDDVHKRAQREKLRAAMQAEADRLAAEMGMPPPRVEVGPPESEHGDELTPMERAAVDAIGRRILGDVETDGD